MRQLTQGAVRICLLITILTAAAMSVTAGDVPERFELVAENEDLMLYIDPGTTEVAVQQKSTGLVWATNPLDRGMVERIAKGLAKNELEAQLVLRYYTPEDLDKTIDSFTESIEYGQFTISELKNGVRVEYQLGKLWDDYAYIPVFISQARLDELLDRIENASDRKLIRSQYYLISIAPYEGEGQWVDIHGFDFIKLFGKSQIISEDVPLRTAADKRRIANLLVNSIYENRADMERADQVQPEDVARIREQPTYVRKSPLRPWEVPRIVQILKQIGYMPDDERAKDDLEYRLDSPEPNSVVFGAAIEYMLDGSSLIVRVPAEDLEYPQDIPDDQGRKVSYRLHTIDILPYFGAAGPSETGYILVPDGSGALIYLNNGKVGSQPYQRPVYGRDGSRSLMAERRSFDELVRLPVFGLATSDRGFFAVIEEGDTLASVRADIAGRTNSYNSVSISVNVLPTARAVVYANEYGTADYLNVYQARPYQGDITIRFFFLSGTEATYAGMARCYQDYLVQRHGLERLKGRGRIPLYVEIIGAIHREQPVLGIPRKVIEPLSTFDDTREIVDTLLRAGVSDLRIRLSGWLSGGLEHDYPAGVRVEEALGSDEELQGLNDYLASHAVSLFADVGFLNVPERAKGFNVRRHASRFLTREVAQLYALDLAANYYDPTGDRYRYVLSPSALPELVSRFLGDFRRLGLRGISLRYMGDQLNADYRPRPSELVDRQQAKETVVDSVRMISSECDLMVTGGFGYLLPYVQHILDAPMKSSGMMIVDEDIPFYQMVLRGYIDYAGEPVNLAQDGEAAILRTIETGASLYFVGFHADSSAVKHTDFDHYYASGFTDWADHAVELYEELSEELGSTYSDRIVDHAVLSRGVHLTTFESGTKVIVNYSEVPVDLDGIRVESRGYTVLKEHDVHED